MLREIVFDTETTGLDAANGDRLIELGCIEIVNRIPTGREFHRYLNPERDIHRDAVAVHGLTSEFLKDKPLFKDVADEFLEFIGDAPLVAHNATFDLGFINAELERAGAAAAHARSRRRHAGPGAPPPSGRPQQPRCAVQALRHRPLRSAPSTARCSNSMLLAGVYVELLGERQATLGLGGQSGRRPRVQRGAAAQPRPQPLPSRLSTEAELAHRDFVKTLGAKPLWLEFMGEA